MEILEITPTNDIGYEPYPTLLKKGIRSESLYFIPAFKLIVKPTKWIDCFYRWFWENNYLHLGRGDMSMLTQYPKPEGKETWKEWNAFEMHITLAEVFDFIYDATPPILRKDLPDSLRTIEDIKDLLTTFLIEESQQREMYQSIFQKITKYGYFEKLNVMDLRYMQAMRDKTPQGLLCQVIYSNKPIDDFKASSTVAFGIFMLGANNNTDIKAFVDRMFKHQQRWLDVCDIHRDPNHGMFIMIRYTGSMLNQLIDKSYSPFLSQ